ncbi:hypothetical protein KIN20_010444 [Parelaphostrongylus tenuis]|uniref:UBA domain-containing protein n=1 Tax=Parelaphostrongylus tenuis TaxID=148309 RepID=A0AAD5MZ31_PARTN|nr:hypothetical protein KIN20_010444 [Parelaphostrongylus tenuis]
MSTVVDQLVDMGFDRVRVEYAYEQTGKGALEVVMDWLISHEGDEIPPPAQQTATARESDKSAETSADFVEGGTIAALTPEERAKKAAELRERIKIARAQKEEAERKEEIEKERRRREEGKKMLEVKQKQKENELRAMAEERRREKQEEAAARQRVLEQIRIDREARKAKASGQQPPPPAPAPTVAHSAPSPRKDYKEAMIQLSL